jgi:hypothetical protein
MFEDVRQRSSRLDLAMMVTTGFAYYLRCAQKIVLGFSTLSKRGFESVTRYN